MGEKRTTGGIGNWLAPKRLLLFVALLPLAYFAKRLAFGPRSWTNDIAIAFDIAAAVFLVSLAPLVRYSDAAAMRAHSAENDANRGFILVLTTLLTIVVMAAIAGQMPAAQAGEPLAGIKLIVTLAIIWLFANSVYALHYAHLYYTHDPARGTDSGGLAFPESATPTYADFAYFAFTLGMTFQTSDVAITSRHVRRIVTLHSFGAFLFNIGVIAFAINVLGGAG